MKYKFVIYKDLNYADYMGLLGLIGLLEFDLCDYGFLKNAQHTICY